MKQKGFSPIIILVLISIVLIVYFGFKQTKKIVQQASPSPITSLKPVVSKLYKDDRYSLEIPEGWTIQFGKNAGMNANSNTEPVSTMELLRNSPFNYDEIFECATKTKQVVVTVDSKKITKTYFTGIKQNGGQCGDGSNFRLIVLTLNKTAKDFLLLQYTTSNQTYAEDSLFKILSTFKFIERSIAPSSKPVACTMEAKLCPDGKTYVGRSGPNCEFAPCPTTP